LASRCPCRRRGMPAFAHYDYADKKICSVLFLACEIKWISYWSYLRHLDSRCFFRTQMISFVAFVSYLTRLWRHADPRRAARSTLMPWSPVQFILLRVTRCNFSCNNCGLSNVMENIHGCNIFASWIFSVTLECLQLFHKNYSELHAIIAHETTVADGPMLGLMHCRSFYHAVYTIMGVGYVEGAAPTPQPKKHL